MKEYITTAVVVLFEGLIGLSKEQAARRPTALKRVKAKKNLYQIIKPVEFKAGEVIAIDPDKATLARLALTEDGLVQKKAEQEVIAQKRLEEIWANNEELDTLKSKAKPTKKDLARIKELETILKTKEE